MSSKPVRQVVLLACLVLTTALPVNAAPAGSSGPKLRGSEVLSYERSTRKLRLQRPDGEVFAVRVGWPARITLDGNRRPPRELPSGAQVAGARVTRRGVVRRLDAVTPQSPNPVPSDCEGVPVSPKDELAKLVISSPPGTTFCLRAGVHRLGRSITPKDGQAFLGEPGAVVSGAVTLDFAPAGATWVASGQTQESSPHGECAKGDACRYNEDVYFDDRLLTRVTARSELAPGRFFFDYDQDEIHIADDPAGHVVEGAVAPQFLSGDPSVSGVVVRGLVVEKFATPAQQGAVDAGGGTGWLVEGNEVRFNHGVGIIAATDGVVRANNVHHNGMQGVGGSGSDLLFEDNEIAYNNTAGFSPGWSASGAKFAHTTRLRVAGNFVHHNEGPGLWTDVSNIHTVYEDNVVEDNADAGIFHEISYDAVIRNNTVNRNGFGTCNWLYGAGILVAHSPNVEVYGNTVLDNCNGIAGIQQDRGSGPHGPHELRNLFVHDNLVRARDGITGVAVGDGDTSVYTNRNNRFRRNTYKVPRTAEVFGWMNHAMNRAEWQAAGQDTDGVFQDP